MYLTRPKNMLSSYFHAVVQAFVIIFLASNAVSPNIPIGPAMTHGEDLCRDQISLVFLELVDGLYCIEKAFLELRNDSEEWKLNKAAQMYYKELRSGLREGFEVHFPEEYCPRFNNVHEQTEGLDLSDEEEKDSDTHLPRKQMELSQELEDSCLRVLKKYFSGTDQNEENGGVTLLNIIERVYDNECNSKAYYMEKDPDLFNSNVYNADIMVSYVEHVLTHHHYENSPISPIDFCAKHLETWKTFHFSSDGPSLEHSPNV